MKNNIKFNKYYNKYLAKNAGKTHNVADIYINYKKLIKIIKIYVNYTKIILNY